MFNFFKNHEKPKAHFLHIGKTGGSAVKFALGSHLQTRKYLLELHGHRTALSDIPKGERVFFFLRDPVSRFVSGFYSRQRKGLPRYHCEWSAGEQQVFAAFNTPNEIACALADRRSKDHSAALQAMAAIQHFAPYRRWYQDLEYFQSRLEDILYIGFQETLNSDFTALKTLLGVPGWVELPSDDITAHRNPEGLDRSIEERGVAALREWYAEDMEFISRCRAFMLGKVLGRR